VKLDARAGVGTVAASVREGEGAKGWTRGEEDADRKRYLDSMM